MGILFTTHMGFLFTITLGILLTITMGFLFTIVLGIQFTISNSRDYLPFTMGINLALRASKQTNISKSVSGRSERKD